MLEMKEFEYYMPVRLIFGRGKVAEAGKLAAGYGKKALVVTGRSSTKRTGLLEQVLKLLEREGLSHCVFDKIDENPTTILVEEGTKLLLDKGCDVVIGLGGGSALDAAKGIAFLAANGGDISEYVFGKPGIGALPLIAITTTAGTGSEGDSLAVLTNPATKDKKALKSPHIYPKAAIIDPELMCTLPKHLIAATGFDALSHCIEAFVAKKGSFITDLLAITGIKNIGKSLPKAYKNPEDLEAWEDMAIANTFGGMALDMAGVTLAHGMEHSVSGLLNVRHGEGLAAIFPVFMEYTCKSAPAKFAQIAEALGEDIRNLTEAEAAQKSLEAVKKLMDEVGLCFSLGKLGVAEEHIEWLVENSIKTMTYAIGNNPRAADSEDLKELYRLCI